jgi:hypothetical protein
MPESTGTRRLYTEEEDRLIYENFYNLDKRMALAKELDRTPGALSLRFYKTILPKHGLTAGDYYAQMREAHVGEQETPQEQPQDELIQSIVSRQEELGGRITTLEEIVSKLKSTRQEALDVTQLLQQKRELERKLEDQRVAYERRLSELHRMYDEKVAEIADFLPKIKDTVEEFDILVRAPM